MPRRTEVHKGKWIIEVRVNTKSGWKKIRNVRFETEKEATLWMFNFKELAYLAGIARVTQIV